MKVDAGFHPECCFHAPEHFPLLAAPLVAADEAVSSGDLPEELLQPRTKEKWVVDQPTYADVHVSIPSRPPLSILFLIRR